MMEKSDRLSLKRDRILEAAKVLFRRDGLRATTMEGIAREAGIAKPTLYSHFPDKSAIFNAIMEQMLTEVLRAADLAFAQVAPLSNRIGDVLAAQYLIIARLVHGSPHAAALMDEPRRSGFQFQERHFRSDARMETELSSAGALDPPALVRLLKAGAHGISINYSDPDHMGAAIRLLARRLIEPELPESRPA